MVVLNTFSILYSDPRPFCFLESPQLWSLIISIMLSLAPTFCVHAFCDLLKTCTASIAT